MRRCEPHPLADCSCPLRLTAAHRRPSLQVCSGWFLVKSQGPVSNNNNGAMTDGVVASGASGGSGDGLNAAQTAAANAAQTAANAAHDASNDASAKSAPIKVLTPKEIYNGLNDHVIGQHRVKMALSVGVHNHYKRINMQVIDSLDTHATHHRPPPAAHTTHHRAPSATSRKMPRPRPA